MPLLTLLDIFCQNKGKVSLFFGFGLMVGVVVRVGGFCLGFFGLPPSLPFTLDASILLVINKNSCNCLSF